MDRTIIEREIKLLYKEYMTSSTNSNSLEVDLTSTTTTTKHHRKSNLLQGFLSCLGKHRTQINKEEISLSIAKELAIYRSLALQEFHDVVERSKEYDPISFWNLHGHQLKFLSTLARKHLIVPGISVPSEATFSVASYIGRKERSRLTPENLCMLVFLKDKISDNMEY